MRYLVLILIIFGMQNSFANTCPLEIDVQSQKYCVDYAWENAEAKLKGKFSETSDLSPQSVKMRTPGPLWRYSSIQIKVWEKSDAEQNPIELKDFKVFPFMKMGNGHAHGTSYGFNWDVAEQVYILNEVVFMQMMNGCWSLRWTTGTEEAITGTNLLFNVTDYQNISAEESKKIVDQCR